MNQDSLVIAGKTYTSRLLVGTGKYKDFDETACALDASGSQIVTVAIRRVNIGQEPGQPSLLEALPVGRYTLLPNTAGCYSADEAVRTLRLARELLDGHALVKLEVLGDSRTLFPNMPETLKAAKTLVGEGFEVMVYCTDDPIQARMLEDILWRLSERTADRAKESGVEGRVVTLKLKTHDFKSFTRRVSLNEATQLAQVIFRAAKPMLARETLGQRYRLLGVGISDLVDAKADAMDLADPKALKRAKAERASDKAREKFGDGAVMTGRGARIELTRKKD